MGSRQKSDGVITKLSSGKSRLNKMFKGNILKTDTTITPNTKVKEVDVLCLSYNELFSNNYTSVIVLRNDCTVDDYVVDSIVGIFYLASTAVSYVNENNISFISLDLDDCYISLNGEKVNSWRQFFSYINNVQEFLNRYIKYGCDITTYTLNQSSRYSYYRSQIYFTCLTVDFMRKLRDLCSLKIPFPLESENYFDLYTNYANGYYTFWIQTGKSFIKLFLKENNVWYVGVFVPTYRYSESCVVGFFKKDLTVFLDKLNEDYDVPEDAHLRVSIHPVYKSDKEDYNKINNIRYLGNFSKYNKVNASVSQLITSRFKGYATPCFFLTDHICFNFSFSTEELEWARDKYLSSILKKERELNGKKLKDLYDASMESARSSAPLKLLETDKWVYSGNNPDIQMKHNIKYNKTEYYFLDDYLWYIGKTVPGARLVSYHIEKVGTKGYALKPTEYIATPIGGSSYNDFMVNKTNYIKDAYIFLCSNKEELVTALSGLNGLNYEEHNYFGDLLKESMIYRYCSLSKFKVTPFGFLFWFEDACVYLSRTTLKPYIQLCKIDKKLVLEQLKKALKLPIISQFLKRIDYTYSVYSVSRAGAKLSNSSSYARRFIKRYPDILDILKLSKNYNDLTLRVRVYDVSGKEFDEDCIIFNGEIIS